MKKFLLIFILILETLCFEAYCKVPDIMFDYIPKIADETCDTIVKVKGYDIRYIKRNGEFDHIGLNLFTPQIKASFDSNLLLFVEESLAAQCFGIDVREYNKVKITKGRKEDFKKITPKTDCIVISRNSQEMMVEWSPGKTKVAVTVPIGYDITRFGSRAEIENRLVNLIKTGAEIMVAPIKTDSCNFELYADDLYRFNGECFKNPHITRNTYYYSRQEKEPVWDSQHPLESIANLFICPLPVSNSVNINLSILKHDYGEKEDFIIPVSQMLSAFEKDGCRAFWGVEGYENGIVKGALFLSNQPQGYAHVLKIECDISNVICNNAEIRARASLYVPINNMRDLNIQGKND